MYVYRQKSRALMFFYFLLAFAFFFPTFESHIGSSGAMIINGGLALSIFVWFLCRQKLPLPKLKEEKDVYFSFAIIFILLLVQLPIAMTVGVLFGDVSLIFRDFFEFHRPILYFLTFSFAFYVFKDISLGSRFNSIIIFLFLGVASIGLVQFFRLNDDFVGLYTKYHNISMGRASAPFTNPYDYAFVMSFFVIYFFLSSLFRTIMYVPLFLLSVVFFVLPQSRSVAAGMLFSFFFVVPVFLFLKGLSGDVYKLRIEYFVYAVILVVSIVAFLSMIPYLIESFPYLTRQFVELFSDGDVGNSANIRLDQFLFALNKGQNILVFLFGNGPSKQEMEFVESMYTYQLYRYGILGIIFYLFYPCLLAILLSWRGLKMVPVRSFEAIFFMSIIIWLLTFPVFFIGNNFTDQVRISFFFYSIMGILASQYLQVRKLR